MKKQSGRFNRFTRIMLLLCCVATGMIFVYYHGKAYPWPKETPVSFSTESPAPVSLPQPRATAAPAYAYAQPITFTTSTPRPFKTFRPLTPVPESFRSSSENSATAPPSSSSRIGAKPAPQYYASVSTAAPQRFASVRTAAPAQNLGRYTLNLESKVIHDPECHTIERTSDYKLQTGYFDLDALLRQGYRRCHTCWPR